MQPSLGEATEAGLGAEAADVVAAHGHDHRRHLGGVGGDAAAEAADDLGGVTEGEELLELVDHQEAGPSTSAMAVSIAPSGSVPGTNTTTVALAAGAQGPARPAPATTCRSPRGRRRPAAASTAGARGTPRSRRRDRRRSPRRRRHRTPGPCRGTPHWLPPPRGPPRAGVLAQDGVFEGDEVRAGVDAELVDQRARARVRDRSASPCRPQRYWARARMAHRRSRNGSAVTSAWASAATSRCSPAASRQSSQSSSAVRRSSSSRAASLCPGATRRARRAAGPATATTPGRTRPRLDRPVPWPAARGPGR